MATLNFAVLDTDDEKKVREYERGMFKAFYGNSPTLPLTREIDIEARLMRSKVPYRDQRILIGTLDGSIIAAIGYNFNMRGELNLERVGFTIDKTIPNTVEGTGMYCNRPFIDKAAVMLEMKNYSLTYLRQQSVEYCYGFCPKRRLAAFRLMGFETINERDVNGENICLIKGAIPAANR